MALQEEEGKECKPTIQPAAAAAQEEPDKMHLLLTKAAQEA